MTINISDFSIGLGKWEIIPDLISFALVATENRYELTSSGTYFSLNGKMLDTTVSSTNSGIYKISSEDVTISGNVYLVVHITNSNDEVLEEDYSLLYGYRLEYITPEKIDWGLNSELVIKTLASNSTICANTESYCTNFITRDYTHTNLQSTITARKVGNLPSYIAGFKPELSYGKRYKVIVEGVKDFSGNVMKDIEFSFIVESKF